MQKELAKAISKRLTKRLTKTAYELEDYLDQLAVFTDTSDPLKVETYERLEGLHRALEVQICEIFEIFERG